MWRVLAMLFLLVNFDGAPGAGVAALSAALARALGALAAQGAAPAHLTSLVWCGPDPAALHPARREVDRGRLGVLGHSEGGLVAANVAVPAPGAQEAPQVAVVTLKSDAFPLRTELAEARGQLADRSLLTSRPLGV